MSLDLHRLVQLFLWIITKHFLTKQNYNMKIGNFDNKTIKAEIVVDGKKF